MKRRYKLILIILIGVILTIYINNSAEESKISLIAIGDGICLGMTPYEMEGTSFNDYLKDYLEKKRKLQNFNNEFCETHLTILELSNIISNNEKGPISNIPIKQTIASSDILTIAIGEDELVDYTMHSELKKEQINKFLTNYEKILNTIRSFYDKDIIIISLYPAYKLDQNSVITINQYLSKLAVEYKMAYLDILSLSKNNAYYLKPTSYYMSYKAHEKISEEIKETLNI